MPFAPPEGTALVAPLGAGTTFEVALVRSGEATLVCKRLVPRMRREAAGRAAMIREAKVLARARHPALPALVRAGADGQGPFLLETQAAGVSLRALAAGWADRGAPVPALLVAHLTRASVRTLAELQELTDERGPLGLVHGDLGPDHLLLGPLGEIRLVDFGASRLGGEAVDPGAPRDRGTLPFVAPEVARGDAPPGPGADVYAVAAVALFLAAGRSPCDARDEAAMLLEIGERGLRADLLDGAAALTAPERSALRSALALDPAARPPTARALLDAMGPERG